MTKLAMFLLFIFSLVACSKFDAQKVTDPLDGSFFIKGEGSLNPSSDKISSDCAADAQFDACLFLKNPVAQEKGPVAAADLNSVRRFGVKMRGLNRTGYLENSWFQVYALTTPRFSLAVRSALKAPAADGKSDLEQISAYYWGNRALEYFQSRVGSERIPLRGVKIYPDDAFTGYSSANNSIHLEKKSNQIAKALSGEVVVYLLGQALVDGLSGKKLFTKDLTQHNYCNLDPKGCCTTEMGCAQALGNSFGEYMAAMAFPDTARVGESIGGAIEGQKICGLARSLSLLSVKTKTEVFSACPPSGRAVLMGAWYASLWWKLRTQLEAGEAGTSADIDKLFFDHAKAFDSTSTFAEAKAEALRLAASYKGGKFLTAFTTAFQGI